MGIEAGKLASASLKLIYHKPIVLIPLLLHFVLATALQAVFVPDLNLLLDSASETAAAQVLTAALPGIALALAVSFLLWVFFYAMATKLVHSARTARAISYADAVHTAKSRYFQYLLLNLIYIHLALAGAALLVVPVFAILLAASSGSFLAIALVSVLGFVWLVALLIIGAVGFLRISLSHYYLVLEGKSAVQSLVASWRATKGNVASLLFLLLIVMAVGIAVSVAVGLATGALTGQATIDAFGSDRISEYIQGLVSALLVAPWSLAAYLLVYLHVKGRWHLPGLRQKK